MAILPIYVFEEQVLRRKAKPVKAVDPQIIKLTQDMLETMRNACGVGLAANQVGILQRIVVIDLSETDEGKGSAPMILLNPRVVREEGATVMDEGCLSLPDLREEVERPERVVIQYRDLEFKEQEILADGFLARALQHEIDHLNGVMFIDHLGIVRRKLLRGRLNKMARGEATAPYPVVNAIEIPRDPDAPRKIVE